MGAMVVLFTLVAFVAIIGWRAHFKSGKKSPKTDRETETGDLPFRFKATVTTRSYDPNTYRFGDSASPEYLIQYADETGEVTERQIYIHNWSQRGAVIYYEAWCFLKDERRTFRSDRILSTINLETNRRIKDISAYRQR